MDSYRRALVILFFFWRLPRLVDNTIIVCPARGFVCPDGAIGVRDPCSSARVHGGRLHQ